MTLPKQSRVVKIAQHGGPEVLTPDMADTPTPAHGEVLIKVAYAGVNRPDALQRAGLYNPPAGASPLPGLECAGEVVALGAGVTVWAVGDQVCALLPG
ncbi:MAG: alcohol dehydrogenase catalytic domain-containing protein, partial [Yoonia sp.]|uniref:alcohol dehydrogenase catalytic domain-containing protein n=1 Tax=Yoonia sp. TaxID=2212373 RepID=UPI0032976F6F